MSISNHGDILSIDGGPNEEHPYQYVISSKIVVRHSISMQKRYRYIPKPTIFCNVSDSIYCIESYGNMIISDINFKAQPHIRLLIWFLFIKEQASINIVDCFFANSSLIELKQTKTFEININNSFATANTMILMMRINKATIFIKFQAAIPDFHITMLSNNQCLIYNTTLINSDFSCMSMNQTQIQNSNFINSSVSIAGGWYNITNSTFQDCTLSTIEHCEKLCDISDCVFDNTPVTVSPTSNIRDTTFRNIVEKSMHNPLTLYTNSRIDKKCFGFKCKFNIIRCSFQNNAIYKEFVRLIYMKGTAQIYLLNLFETEIVMPALESTIFVIKNQFLLTVRNFSVSCGRGNFLKMLSMKDSDLSPLTLLRCVSCEKGQYNINGDYHIWRKSQMWWRVKMNQSDVCLDCPSNGKCEGGQIRSKGAYWGYKKSTNEIEFLPCPASYCCPSLRQCSSYNTCAENRQGRLCSDCRSGYSCSLNSNKQCVSSSKCKNVVVAFIIICLSSIGFVAIILYLNEITLFMKKIFAAGKKPVNGRTESCENLQEKLLQTTTSDVSNDDEYQTVPISQPVIGENNDSASCLISGLLKITFFFYQAASIIRIQSPEKLNFNFPTAFDFMLTFFNIKIDLVYSKSPMCILPNLSIIATEMLKLSVIWIVFLLLFLVAIFACCHHKITAKNVKVTETYYTVINKDVPRYSRPPMLTRVKCAYLQFLLIGFASIATFCFNATYCVNINGNLYLFQQASTACYQPWQYGLFAFIALWIVPFPLALYFSTKHLYQCIITPNRFLADLTFPPLIILSFITSRKDHGKKLNQADAMTAKSLLLIVNEPFKESSRGDGSRLCWESILILRRMLLVIMKTYIMSPITKLYPMALLIAVFAFHHVVTAPYSNRKLNKFEFFSLSILITFIYVNMFWAITREYDLTASSSYKTLAEVLLFYEMLILVLPFLLLVICIIIYAIKKCLLVCKFLKRKLS